MWEKYRVSYKNHDMLLPRSDVHFSCDTGVSIFRKHWNSFVFLDCWVGIMTLHSQLQTKKLSILGRSPENVDAIFTVSGCAVERVRSVSAWNVLWKIYAYIARLYFIIYTLSDEVGTLSDEVGANHEYFSLCDWLHLWMWYMYNLWFVHVRRRQNQY